MLYCKDCQAERVIGFYCKGGGFCPGCGSRRALQKADRIELEVWPREKARQWVLTFPHQVHARLLRSPDLFNEVISVVINFLAWFIRIRFRGVFAPNHAWRDFLVPGPAEKRTCPAHDEPNDSDPPPRGKPSTFAVIAVAIMAPVMRNAARAENR